MAPPIVSQIDRESLGDRLRSTALIPFMRSKNINFVVDGLKPNTRVYPFFDKVDVTKFVTPATGGVGTVTCLLSQTQMLLVIHSFKLVKDYSD